VYSHASGEGFAWPEDVPPDVAEEALTRNTPRQKPRLAAVTVEMPAVAEASVRRHIGPLPDPPRPPAGRGHLRLVK
jgi:hypothetical protein